MRQVITRKHATTRLCCDQCGYDWSISLAGKPCPECGAELVECQHHPRIHAEQWT